MRSGRLNTLKVSPLSLLRITEPPLPTITMEPSSSSVAPDTGGVTIEMKTSFMLPARGALVAKGQLLHKTHGGMAYVEGAVYDAQGLMCCKASGTFKLKRRDPAAQSAAD